jgi:ribonuclease HI
MDKTDIERLAEIRRRAEKATPGPWRRGYYDGSSAEPDDREGVTITSDPKSATDGYGVVVRAGHDWGVEYGVLTLADADFIANAPADIAYLLSALEQAEERNATMQKLLTDITWSSAQVAVRRRILSFLKQTDAATGKAEEARP